MKVKGWESSLVFFFLSINCLVVMYVATTTSLFVCYNFFYLLFESYCFTPPWKLLKVMLASPTFPITAFSTFDCL